ncbi:MAG: hypothetical protein KJ737_05965 [Proteobacteria bacterium]|nr:hypothetical protein [Pseudomonadota bacterium]
MALDIFLGKSLQEYGYEDLIGLDRKQLMALFCQLESPSISEMNGEYRAALLDNGHVINQLLAWFYLYFTWGPWQHKAFEPIDAHCGHGYNTFVTSQSSLSENCILAGFDKMLHIAKLLFQVRSPARMARFLKNNTTIVASVFDGRPSFQLNYRYYNQFYTNTMIDELRKVNDRLFLGIGRLKVTFGKYNPFPFALMGPPDPWVGPDIPFPE